MKTIYSLSAARYLRAGWFPVPVHGKTIPAKGATGRNGTVTPEKVARWIEENPSVRVPHKDQPDTFEAATNITLRHDGTLAVDVDDYGVTKTNGKEIEKHGPTELVAFARKHGLTPLPATWSSTARGPRSASRQYLYRLGEQDVRLRTKPCPSVEICYIGHRHTVVAPTIHPKLRRPYTWYEPGGPGIPPTWGEATDAVPTPAQMPAFPGDWLEAIRAQALNADENASVVGLEELLATFPDGEPDGLIRHLLAKWSDPSQHVGHDEMRTQGINILMLGREGHPGVPELWELFHGRYSDYVHDVRPEEANKQLYEDSGVVALAVRVAQQKPVKPQGPIVIGRLPTVAEFMAGAEVAPGTLPGQRLDCPEAATDEDVEAFLATFTRYTDPRRLARREQWMKDDPPHRIGHHAVRLCLDAIQGHYPADRAVRSLINGYRHHGVTDASSPRNTLKLALGAILHAKVDA